MVHPRDENFGNFSQLTKNDLYVGGAKEKYKPNSNFNIVFLEDMQNDIEQFDSLFEKGIFCMFQIIIDI
jgi:hypothetical protein